MSNGNTELLEEKELELPKKSFFDTALGLTPKDLEKYEAPIISQITQTEPFLERDIGYLPSMGSLAEYRAQTQSEWERFGKVIPSFVVGTSAKVLEGFSMLGGGILGAAGWGLGKLTSGEVGLTGEEALDMTLNNAFAKVFENLDETAKENWFKIYPSEKYLDGTFSQQMGTTSFWYTDFLDGLEFLTAAYVPAGYISSFGLTARTAKGLGRLIAMAKAGKPLTGIPLESASKITKLANSLSTAEATALASAFEAPFEGKETQQNILRELEPLVLSGEITQEEADYRAAEGAAGDTRANFITLMLTNYLPMHALTKGVRGFGNVVKDVTKAGTTKIPGLTSTDKVANFLGVGAATSFMEGDIEENAQLALRNYYTDKALGKKDEGIIDSIIRRMGENYGTREGKQNIYLGRLLGFIPGGIGGIKGINREVEKRQRLQQIFKRDLDTYKERIRSYIKKDEQGNIVKDDDGISVLDEKKIWEDILDKTNKNKIERLKALAAFQGNKDIYENIRHQELADWVYSYLQEEGGLDYVLSQLDNLYKEDQVDILFGKEKDDLGNEISQEERLENDKNFVKEIARHIPILENYVSKGIRKNPRYNEQLKFNVFMDIVRHTYWGQRLKDINKAREETDKKLEDIEPIVEEIDSFIREFYAQRGHITDLERRGKGRISESVLDTERDKLRQIKKKIDKAIKDNEDFLKERNYKENKESPAYVIEQVKTPLSDQRNRLLKSEVEIQAIIDQVNQEFKDITNEKKQKDGLEEFDKSERQRQEEDLRTQVETITFKDLKEDELEKKYNEIKKSPLYTKFKKQIDDKYVQAKDKLKKPEVISKVTPKVIKTEGPTQEEIEKIIETQRAAGEAIESATELTSLSKEEQDEANKGLLKDSSTPGGGHIPSEELILRKGSKINIAAYLDVGMLYTKEGPVDIREEGRGVLIDLKDPMIRSSNYFQVGDEVEIYLDTEYMKENSISMDNKDKIVYAIRRPGQDKAATIHEFYDLQAAKEKNGIDENIAKFIPELKGKDVDPLKLQREQQQVLEDIRNFLYEELITKKEERVTVKVGDRRPGHVKVVKENNKPVYGTTIGRLGNDKELDPGVVFGVVNLVKGEIELDLPKGYTLWPVKIKNYVNGHAIVTVPTSIRDAKGNRFVMPFYVERNRLSDEDIELLVHILTSQKPVLSLLKAENPIFEELGIGNDEQLVNLLVFNGARSRNFYINWGEEIAGKRIKYLQASEGETTGQIKLRPDNAAEVRQRLKDLRDTGPLSYNLTLDYLGKNIPRMELVDGKIQVTITSYIDFIARNTSTPMYRELIPGIEEYSYFDQSTIVLDIPYKTELLKGLVAKKGKKPIKEEKVPVIAGKPPKKLSVAERLKLERAEIAKKADIERRRLEAIDSISIFEDRKHWTATVEHENGTKDIFSPLNESQYGMQGALKRIKAKYDAELVTLKEEKITVISPEGLEAVERKVSEKGKSIVSIIDLEDLEEKPEPGILLEIKEEEKTEQILSEKEIPVIKEETPLIDKKIEETVEEKVTGEELEEVKVELKLGTKEETKKVIIERTKKDFKDNGTKIVINKKSALSRIIAKIKRAIIGILLSIGVFTTYQASTLYSVGQIEQFAERGLVKFGIEAPIEEKLELSKDTAKYEDIVKDTIYEESITKFEILNKDKKDIWSFRNQFLNKYGFVYVTGVSNQNFKNNRNIVYDNVKGIAHHLIMLSESTDLTDRTSDSKLNNTGKNILATTNSNDYVPIIERLGNNKVKITYIQKKNILSLNINQFTPLKLRQINVSELDFSKSVSAEGFKKHMKAVSIKGTDKGFNSLVYYQKDNYGTFSGGSVVLLFKDSKDNLIVREYSGSVTGVQQEIETVKSQFNITDEDITLGVYDAGSYTGKVSAIDGKVSPRQYEGYNPSDKAGASLMIPQEKKAETPAEFLLLLLARAKRKKEEGEKLNAEEEKALEEENKIQLRHKLQSDEVPGFTSQEARNLTLAVGGLVIDEIKESPKISKDRIFSRVYGSLHDFIKTLTEELNDHNKGTKGYNNRIRRINNINKLLGSSEENEAWTKTTERVSRYLDSMSEHILSEEERDRSNDNYKKVFDRDKFYLNPKNTASGRLRTWLANLDDTEYGKIEDRKVVVSKISLIGTPVKLPFDTVYNRLISELANKDMNDFMSILHKLGKNNSNYENIADELAELGKSKSLDDRAVYKEFHTSFGKQQIKYITVLHDFPDTMVIDANRNNAHRVQINKWRENFENQANKRNGIVKKDPNGNLIVNTALARELRKELEEKEGEQRIEMKKGLPITEFSAAFVRTQVENRVEVLRKIGIDLKDEAVDFILDPESRELIEGFDFPDFMIAYKFIMDRLSGDLREEIRKIPLEISNPFISEPRMRLLADIHIKTDPGVLAGAFLDEESQIRYTFMEKTDLSKKIEKLKDPDHIKRLMNNDSYYEDNSHLKKLLTDKNFRNNYEVFALSAINEKGKWKHGRAWDKLSTFDKLFLMITSFTNAGFRDPKFSYMIFPVMGDRNTPYFVKVPRLVPQLTEDKFDAATLENVYNIFLSEIKSIKKVQEQIKTLRPEQLLVDIHIGDKAGDKAGLKFHLLPQFNDFKLDIGGNSVSITSDKIDYTKYEADVKKEINKILLDNVEKTRLALANHRLGIEYLGQHYLDSLKVGDPKNQFKKFIVEFSVNLLVHQSNLFQIFWGNMAYYKRASEATRRGAMLGSPGTEFMIRGDFKAVFINDIFSSLRNYDNLYEGLKKGLEAWKIDPKKAKEIIDSYGDINTTDSQALASFKGYRTALDAVGRRTEKVERVLSKLENKEPLTEDDVERILPLKLVFVAQVYDPVLKSFVQKNIKFSVMPPMPGYNEELDQVLEDMEDKVDFLFFKSAVKTGGLAFQDFYNEDKTKVFTIDPNLIQELPWEGMREQQITPNTEVNEKMSAYQEADAFFMDTKELTFDLRLFGKSYNVDEAFTLFDKLRSANTLEALDDFKKQFGVEYVEEDIKITDLKRLNLFLQEEARNAHLSENTIRSFKLEKIDKDRPEEIGNLRFIVPLHFLPNSIRIEHLLNSLIKNRLIRQKTFQDSFVLASDLGGKLISEIPPNVKDKIEWVDKAKEKIEYYKVEDDRVLPAQFILPYEAKKYFGEDKRFIGHRDPFQTQGSLYYGEVVGFFPEGYKGIIVAPFEFIQQVGHDFDFDKVPVYFFKGEQKEDKFIKTEYIVGDDDLTKEKRYRKYEDFKLQSKKAKKIYEKHLKVPTKITPSELAIENLIISLKHPDLQSKFIEVFGSKAELEEYILRLLLEDDTILSEAEFYKLSEERQNTKDARNNALLEIRLGMLEHIEMLPKLMMPNTQDPIERSNHVISERLREVGVEREVNIPTSLDSWISSMEANAEGKFGVSIFSLGVTNHSRAQRTDLRIKLKDEGEVNVSYGAMFKNSKGEIYKDDKDRPEGAFMLNKVYTFEREFISSILQWLQTTSLDNAQHLQMAEANLNHNTIPVANLLSRLGFNVDITDDGIIIPFLRQPIIRRYTALMLNEDTPVKIEGERLRTRKNIRDEILKEIKNEYLDAANKDLKKEDHIEFNYSLDMVAFSREELIDNIIEGKNPTPEYYKKQLEALNQFIHLEDIARDLGTVSTTVNTATKFEGNYFDIKERIKRYQGLGNLRYIENAEQLLENTFAGTIKDIVYFAEKVFSHPNLLGYGLPLWKNIINDIEELNAGEQNINLGDKGVYDSIRREVNAFTTSYEGTTLYKNKRDDETIYDFHKRLLMGDNSIPSRMSRFRDSTGEFEGIEEGKDNLLNSFITVEKAPVPDEIDEISIEDDMIDPSLRGELTQAMIQILNSDNTVVRELGEDLIAYIYITSGGNRAKGSLSIILPTEYLELGFGQFFNDETTEGFLEISRKREEAENFIRQLHRKNPGRARFINVKRLQTKANHPNVVFLKDRRFPKFIYTTEVNRKTKEKEVFLFEKYTDNLDHSKAEYHRLPLLETYDANTLNPESIIAKHNLKSKPIPLWMKDNKGYESVIIPEKEIVEPEEIKPIVSIESLELYQLRKVLEGTKQSLESKDVIESAKSQLREKLKKVQTRIKELEVEDTGYFQSIGERGVEKGHTPITKKIGKFVYLATFDDSGKIFPLSITDTTTDKKLYLTDVESGSGEKLLSDADFPISEIRTGFKMLEDIKKEPLTEYKLTGKGINFQEEQTVGYKVRTIKNASADATIALAYNFNSAGERLTKKSVLEQGKKYIALNIPKKTPTSDISTANIKTQVNIIVQALNSVNAKTLNIAGNGIYTMKDAGWSQSEVDLMTYRIIKAVVESSDLKTKIESIRTGGQTGFDEAGAKAGVKLGLSTTILAPKGWTFRNVQGQDISNEKQFKDRFKEFYQLERETEKLPDEKLDAIMKELVTQLGGKIEVVEQLKTKHGLDAVAITELLTKTIKVVKGKADITTLPEEAATLFVSMLGINHPMVQRMISLVDKTSLYEEVKRDYILEYEGREEDIKLETVHKFLAKYVVNQHKSEEVNKTLFEKLIATARMIWNRIKQIFSRVDDVQLQRKIDEAFGVVAKMMREGDISEALESELPDKSFYQINKQATQHLTRIKHLDDVIIRWNDRIRELKLRVAKTEAQKSFKRREIINLQEKIEKLSKDRDSEFILLTAEKELYDIDKQIKDSDVMSLEEKVQFFLTADRVTFGWSNLNKVLSFEDIRQKRVDEITSRAQVLDQALLIVARQIVVDITEGKLTHKDISESLSKTLRIEAEILDLSTSKDKRSKAMFNFIDKSLFFAQTMTDTLIEKTDKMEKRLKDFAKSQNFKIGDAYAKMLQIREADEEWTGNYVHKYRQEYYDKVEELASRAKETNNWREFYRWKDKNSTRIVDYKTYEEDRKVQEGIFRKDDGEWNDETAYLNFVEQYNPDGTGKHRDHYAKDKDSIPNDEWIDPRWRLIKEVDLKNGGWKDTEIETFYDFFVETITELKNLVSDYGFYEQQKNYIPEMTKTMLKKMMEQGIEMFMKGLGKNTRQYLKSAWTSPIEPESVISIKDERTGEFIKRVPLTMMNNQIASKDKSNDLGQVLKHFAAVAYTYDAQTAVEPIAGIMLRLMKELKTKDMTGDIQKKDVYGRVSEIMDQNSATFKAMRYYVDSMIYEKSKMMEKENRKPIRKILGFIDLPVETMVDEDGNIVEKPVAFSEVKAWGKLITYTQLLGMGWNIFAAMTNVIFGPITNFIWAAGGQEFDIGDMFKAYALSLTLLSPGGEGAKIRALFKSFHFQGLRMEDQYEDAWYNKGNMDLFYGLQHMGEIFNQSQVMIAYMNHKKIEYEKGKFISMYDGFKMEDGKLVWDTKYGKNPIPRGSDAQYEVKKDAQQIIFNNHGAYASNVPMKFKETVGGRMLMIFRTWMPRSYFARFASEREGISERTIKGRYITLKDLLLKGRPGALIGLGWENLSEIDKANMKKNYAEIFFMTIVMMSGILLRGMKTDDDDDWEKGINTFFVNQLGRTSSEIAFWFSPSAFFDITRNISPALGTLEKAGKLFNAIPRYLSGDDILKAGPDKGRSNFGQRVEDLTPLWFPISKTIGMMKGEKDYLRSQGFALPTEKKTKTKKKKLKEL